MAATYANVDHQPRKSVARKMATPATIRPRDECTQFTVAMAIRPPATNRRTE